MIVGSNIGALSIIRSLGRRSIQVILLTADNSDYAAKSRYCQVIKCGNYDSETLLEKLQKIAGSLSQKSVLFCTKDSTVLMVAEHQSMLGKWYHFVMPSLDVVKMLMSKQQFHKFATENGFRVPTTFLVNNREDFDKIGQIIQYPCIIKPEFRDDRWVQKVSVLHKVFLARNKEEYLKYYSNYHLADYRLIVQEWIDGSDADVYYCLAYLNRDQKPLAVFTGRKIRQFPILTGSTALAESLQLPNLADDSIRLLQTAGCVGLCSVEFKFSKNNNSFVITEPTVGRVDTQEGSSINSGMDIPFLAYLDALNLDPEPPKSFQEGVKWINEPEDYSSVRNYLKNKNITAKELLASYKGKRSYALKAMDDPLPFIYFLGNLCKRGFKRFSQAQH